MPYRFATEKQDYSDYARGRVLYGQHGHPAYPVRLASEVWQRCVAVLRAEGRAGPYVLYDPCCGSGYLLTTLALLQHQRGENQAALELAEQAIQSAQELGVPAFEAEALANLGHAQTALGQLSEAADAYQGALSLRREFGGRGNLVLEPLADGFDF